MRQSTGKRLSRDGGVEDEVNSLLSSAHKMPGTVINPLSASSHKYPKDDQIKAHKVA